MPRVPQNRIRLLNNESVNSNGHFVLYWMIAFRRSNWNFSLQRAIELAKEHQKPLVVLEALRCDYPWASDRIHRFVIDGMFDNEAAFAKSAVTYYPYIEEYVGAGRGMLREFSRHAVAVVTDDFPCFFLPRMTQAAAQRCGVTMEAIDSNGLYPMHETDRVFSRAHHFRRHLQKSLLPHLNELPQRNPLRGQQIPQLSQLPTVIQKRWPATDLNPWRSGKRSVLELPIDHDVTALPIFPGGSQRAQRRLRLFLRDQLQGYDDRNQPDRDVCTGLSAHLHFGHIATHQVFAELVKVEGWTSENVATKPNGSAQGWWNMSPPAEQFLDQLITWRELGYNMCCHQDNYDQYESLPEWAQGTLAEHESDARDYLYTLEEFEAATTHDELWNAAQNQLVREGRMHNYLRMLWGKKILEWSPTARDALAVMIELNNKYAFDGRNPNSYSGIFWILGRYDRAWGPERKVFGKVRYMSSTNTARKLRIKDYLARYGSDASEHECEER